MAQEVYVGEVSRAGGTHVRLRRGLQVTKTDWESFTCTEVTGEAAE